MIQTAQNNFTLSEEQTMIRDTVRKFVADVAQPGALEADEHRKFVGESLAGLVELGLLGLLVDEDSGGLGLGSLCFVVALEEIGSACGSTAVTLLIQAGHCGKALEGIAAAAGILGEILGGETLAAYVGPEFGIMAQSKGEAFHLHGAADLVLVAGEAKVLLVAARIGDDEAALFRVDADQIERSDTHSLGFRAAAPASLQIDTELAAAALLARGDDAQQAIRRADLAAQIGGAAMALGAARSCLELSSRYAKERIAFGKPIAKLQAVTHKLVSGHRMMDAARHQTYHAARLADAGLPSATDAMMARLGAVDAAVFAADEGIQIHGGFGFTIEYQVERHYRDAKTLEVLDHGQDELRDRLGIALG